MVQKLSEVMHQSFIVMLYRFQVFYNYNMNVNLLKEKRKS